MMGVPLMFNNNLPTFGQVTCGEAGHREQIKEVLLRRVAVINTDPD